MNKREALARIHHLVWCGYQMGAGLPYNIEPTPEQLKSVFNSVDAFNKNPDMTPEQNHKNWMEFKLSQGWKFGLVKDEEKKTHPDLVAYALLSEVERMKDEMDNMANSVGDSILESFDLDCWDRYH